MKSCVFLDAATLGNDVSLESLSSIHKDLHIKSYPETASNESLIQARLKDADGVITNKVRISEQTLQACPKLKVIFSAATGVDHIDVAAANTKKIPVYNTRNYAGPSLAQHVFASILYFANQQHLYHKDVVNGIWSKQKMFCLLDHPIDELQDKTLGIIGYGELGSRVAKLGTAFGMQVKVCESLASTLLNADTPASQKPTFIERTPFPQILQTSDFISLHCPLTSATRHLFGEQEFRQMKPSAILINTARGDIVKTTALLEALDSKTIMGAALDVYNQEPLPENDPLLQSRANLLLTPHIAWGSQAARQRLVTELNQNLTAWLQGKHRNQVFL